MWCAPAAPLGPRPARFRALPTESNLGATTWDMGHEARGAKPKFQSGFTPRPAASRQSQRSNSVLSCARAAYLRTATDAGSDAGSAMAADRLSTIADSSVGESCRLEEEFAQLRTGDDAVQFFARHGTNCMIKVLYCNKQSPDEDSGSSPCSLIVVPQHKVQAEHFTISASGVFHVCPGEMSECTPLSEWIHRGMMYSVLKAIPFFKLFVYQKSFTHWKANARTESYKRRRQRLSRSCFVAKPLFVGALKKLQKLTNDVQELPLLQLSNDSQRLLDFAHKQLEVRSNPSMGTHAELERTQDQILEVLTGLVSRVQKSCANVAGPQERATQKSRSKSITQEKQEAREQARRSQMCEYDLARLGTFIRLADYMLQAARVTCVTNAVHALSTRLTSGHRVFSVDALFQQGGVVLNPPHEDFSRELDRLWDGSVEAVSSMLSLASSAQFKNQLPHLHKVQTVESILSSCGKYQQQINHIQETIFEQLQAAEGGANELYMRYYHIFKFGEEWDEDAFANQEHTLESLSKQVQLMSEFKGDLVGFRLHRVFGAIAVNGTELRSSLEPIYERGLMVTMRMLSLLAHEKGAATNQQVITAIKALDERPHTPHTPQAVKSFSTVCETVDDQLAKAEMARGELESAWRLLTKQGFRVSVEDQLLLDQLQMRCLDLQEVKLPQAKAFLESLPPDVVVHLHTPGCDEVHGWPLSSNVMDGEELGEAKSTTSG